MQFSSFSFSPVQAPLAEKLAQINLMLQNNYSAIARLEEVPFL